MGIGRTREQVVRDRTQQILQANRHVDWQQWEKAHMYAELHTIPERELERRLGATVAAPVVISNRPTPRLASHHYFAVDNDSRNYYFY
jgi:hypothetical protein